MTMRNTRSYSELIAIESFKDRLTYLREKGLVGDQTFGGHRYLNQMLYCCPEWRSIRRKVILRDGGLDLAHPDYLIGGRIYVHHMNPITVEDILNRSRKVFDMENLVSCSFDTHNAIHYGSDIPKESFAIRKENDTCPWR